MIAIAVDYQLIIMAIILFPNHHGHTDDNECLDGTSNCGANAICINLPGSYRCECTDGYTGNGFICIGVFCVE